MRVSRAALRLLGVEVFTLELEWVTYDEPEQDEEPTLQAMAGGEFERAEDYGVPDVTVTGGGGPVPAEERARRPRRVGFVASPHAP